jgi:hypothetical protein
VIEIGDVPAATRSFDIESNVSICGRRDRLDAADDRRELHVARAAIVGVEVHAAAVRRPAQVDRIAIEVAADLPHVAAPAAIGITYRSLTVCERPSARSR